MEPYLWGVLGGLAGGLLCFVAPLIARASAGQAVDAGRRRVAFGALGLVLLALVSGFAPFAVDVSGRDDALLAGAVTPVLLAGLLRRR